MTNKQRICSIYRCSKKEGMYLYVDKEQGLADIPDALIKRAGNTELAMTLLITPDKKLAHASANEVLEQIASQGFYLQMPPSLSDLNRDASMQDLRNNNYLLK